MKNQVELTPYGLETWAAVLSQYDTAIVQQAILRIGLSTDPFPDLGKVVLVCEQLRRRAAGTEPQGGTVSIGDGMLRKIAGALGFDIG